MKLNLTFWGVFNLWKWTFLCDWFTWESWLSWLREDLWTGFEASLAEHNILLNFLFSPRECTHMHALTHANAKNTPVCHIWANSLTPYWGHIRIYGRSGNLCKELSVVTHWFYLMWQQSSLDVMLFTTVHLSRLNETTSNVWETNQ